MKRTRKASIRATGAAFLAVVSLSAFGQSGPHNPDSDGCWIPPHQCVSAAVSEQGSSVFLTFENYCGGRVYVAYCMERAAGQSAACWQWGLDDRERYRVEPDPYTPESLTGRYRWIYVGSNDINKDWICAQKVQNWDAEHQF